MSDSDRIESAGSPETGGGLPVAESTAEAKRIAARRRFLARGLGGAGFAVLTLAHQRTNAWWNPPTSNTDHILSLPYADTTKSATQARIDCASFARGRPYTAYKGTYEGQSPNNPTPKGSYIWYCG